MATTTLRLSAKEKRHFAAEARRRGITLSAFLRDAARKETLTRENPWRKFFTQFPPADFDAPRDLSTREGFGR
jgi:hypothetical protein